MNETPTPRMDFEDDRGDGLVESDFARQLERELAEALRERDTLRSALAVAQEALETCARLPVASLYPDSPCLDNQDHDEVKAALAAITAATKPAK